MDDSYIKLESSKVAELATNRIARANDEHTEAWRSAISHYRGGRDACVKMGAFWLTKEKDLSDDECKYLINNGKWHLTHPPVYNSWTVNRCTELLAAASASDFVYLSVKDYRILIS